MQTHENWALLSTLFALTFAGQVSSLHAEVAVVDECLPRLGGSVYTSDDVTREQYRREMIARSGGIPPPVSVVLLPKYQRCVQKARAPDAYVLHDLLSHREVLLGYGSLLESGAAFTLGLGAGYAARGAGVLAGQVYGAAAGWSGAKLSDYLASYIWADDFTLIENKIRERLRDALAQNPTANPVSLVLGFADQMKGSDLGFSSLDPATIEYYRSIAVQVAAQFSASTSEQPRDVQDFLREAPQPVAADLPAQRQKQLGLLSEQSKKLGVQASNGLMNGASKRLDAGPSPIDWKHLRAEAATYFGGLSASEMTAKLEQIQAERAAGTRNGFEQISNSDIAALLADSRSRKRLAELSVSSAELAQGANAGQALALALKNPDAARWFSALSASATTVSTITALASQSVGPMGGYQLLLTAGALANLGNTLGSAFGGDSSAADSQKALFGAIQSIFASLQELRQIALLTLDESRDQFALVARSLGLVLRVQTAQAMTGLVDCNRIVSGFAASDQRQDSATSSSRLLKYIFKPGDAKGIYAANCISWLYKNAAPLSEAEGVYEVNPLFLYELDVAKLNSRGTPAQRLELSKFNFTILDRGYPALMGLLQEEGRLKGFDVGPALLYPVDTLTALTEKLALLETDATRSQLVDIGDRYNALHRLESRDWRVSYFLSEPIAAAPLVESIDAITLLHPVVDHIADDGSHRDSNDILRGQKGDQFVSVMKDYLGLALVSIASEVAQTGDVLLPLIDEVLDSADREEAITLNAVCTQAGNSPDYCRRLSHGSEGEPCAEKIRSDSPRLCVRMGKRRFDGVHSDAIRAIQEFPELRDNLVMYRIWRVTERLTKPSYFAPAYAIAYGVPENSPSDAQQAAVFLKSVIAPLEPSVVDDVPGLLPSDEYLAAGRLFIRLSGKCDGLTKKPMLGRAVCTPTQGCDASIDTDANGKYVLKATSRSDDRFSGDRDAGWEKYRLETCVMGPLPSPAEFADGHLKDTYALRHLRDSTERLITQLALQDLFANSSAFRQWQLLLQVRAQ